MDSSGELGTAEDLEGNSKKEEDLLGRRPRRGKFIFGRGARLSPLLLASAAVLTSLIVLKRFWRRRKWGSVAALLEGNLVLPEPSLTEATPLNGLQFVCSALTDIEGAYTRFTDGMPCSRNADVVTDLLKAGVRLKGRTTSEELNLGLHGEQEEVENPAAPECSISGCGCGPAAVVAHGLADIGVGLDHVSGIRVQSAVFGLSAFRPTHGELSSRGMASIAGSLDSVAWLVQDPSLHPKIAEAIRLPGAKAAFNNTELLQVVVASEVFELFGETGKRLKAVAMSAAKKWAGPEQAASGLLISYLEKNVLSAKSFLGEKGDDADVLEGIRRATATLQHNALLQEYGHLLEEPDAIRPDILETLTNAQNVSEEDTLEAEQVARETKTAMKNILKGVILILPSLPFPQPARGSDKEELKQWEKGSLKLAALATLTGCPQATLPVRQGEGKPPLGLALFSMPKTDQRLAYVTAALAPLVNFAADEKNIAKSPKHPSAQTKAAKKELSDKRQEQLEEAKSTGNDAFKNGNYQEAIKQYTIGIDISGKKSPASCVLFSNRALCHIKLGLYQQAEDDGTAALQSGPNAKALLRRGTARSLMFKHKDAIQDFQHVLSLEPNNRQAKKELDSLLELGDDSFAGGGGNSARSNIGTARSSLA